MQNNGQQKHLNQVFDRLIKVVIRQTPVIANAIASRQINCTETTTLYTAIAYLAHLLLRETHPCTHAKAKKPNSLAPF
jgi:hypothetical protein